VNQILDMIVIAAYNSRVSGPPPRQCCRLIIRAMSLFIEFNYCCRKPAGRHMGLYHGLLEAAKAMSPPSWKIPPMPPRIHNKTPLTGIFKPTRRRGRYVVSLQSAVWF
jgi:hypothetical protein